MQRFHIIQDAEVITVSKSVYKQAKVYHRGEALYVGAGGGFVRLYAGGNTGLPNLRWDDIEIPGVSDKGMIKDAHGKLSLPASFLQIEGAVR